MGFITGATKLTMRNRQLGVLGALVFIIFCFYSISRKSPAGLRSPTPESAPAQEPAKEADSSEIIAFTSQKFPATKPKPAPGTSHPIWHLVADAEQEFEAVKARQSQTLPDAVAEYRRRYGLPPPPHFDKWWAFARSKNVQLVDEFDTILDMLTPFWGLKPSTIRARTREALGFDNGLHGMQVRDGKATHFGGPEWEQQALDGMMKNFVEFLPDMDIAFNIHDEPRVMVPHDDMSRLVHTARTVAMPAANAAKSLRNGFSEKPSGLSYNGRLDEVKLTRFDFFAHQPVWTHSRMSCPPDSPARILDEDDQFDDIEKYAVGELGFVSNWTAMSDICLSPSLASTYGFFSRPNSYGVVHDLFPIFSQSKISSYADIIYPSPWYYADKVPYADANDRAWGEKLDRLYWRGSTTGGFSREGGWRRQHRQRFVQKINAPDQAKILAADGRTPRTVPRGDYKALLDVYFSHIGQCDPGDCDAQRAFFKVKEYAKQEDALQYKHVLDMDGNAFSGRFYAFLRSKSLVYKWAIFREWHYEWLRPWVHYVPLSLHGEEWLEVVRYFAARGNAKRETPEEGNGEGDGGDDKVEGDGLLGLKEAERLAMQGREWAGKALRNEDLEVWFFRLLLEYGRVIDDDRENIGYAG